MLIYISCIHDSQVHTARWMVILCLVHFIWRNYGNFYYSIWKGDAGADPWEGGAPDAPPLKLGKIWFFSVKSWFFTRNTPKIFAPPSARRDFFKYAPISWKSWIRPWDVSTKGKITLSEIREPYRRHWTYTELNQKLSVKKIHRYGKLEPQRYLVSIIIRIQHPV